jgi:hyaluronoglucosaminidase|nr:MAG TPA: hyaluronidase [Caudoviricetes sp.]
MTEVIPVRVQHKRMDLATWNNSEIILLNGEIGIESDTGKAKVGNGTDLYKNLPYIAGARGEKGDRGDQGIPGIQGIQGVQGERGTNGKDAILGNYNLIVDSNFKINNLRLTGSPETEIIQDDYNGHNSLRIRRSGATTYTWAGVQIVTNVSRLKQGDKLVLRLPMYVYDDVEVDHGIYFAVKKHSVNKTVKSIDFSNLQKNKWVIHEEIINIEEDVDFSNETHWFYLYAVKNGHFKVAEPYIGFGEKAVSRWEPSVEDLKSDTVLNTQNNQPLKYWVGTQEQYDAITVKDSDTIYDIVK